MARKKRKTERQKSEYQLTEYLICRVTPDFLKQLGRLADIYSAREGSTITGPLLARRILSEVVPDRLEKIASGREEEPDTSPLPLLRARCEEDPDAETRMLPLLDPKR